MKIQYNTKDFKVSGACSVENQAKVKYIMVIVNSLCAFFIVVHISGDHLVKENFVPSANNDATRWSTRLCCKALTKARAWNFNFRRDSYHIILQYHWNIICRRPSSCWWSITLYISPQALSPSPSHNNFTWKPNLSMNAINKGIRHHRMA